MTDLYGFHLRLLPSGQTVRVIYTKHSSGDVEFKAVHEQVIGPQNGGLTWFDGSTSLHDRLRQQVLNSKGLRIGMFSYGRLLSELGR